MRERLPRVRVTVGRMMLVVALVGVTLAAARVHALLGLYACGAATLALDRLFSILGRCRVDGRSLSPGQLTRLTLGSAAAGAMIAWIPLTVFATVFAAACFLLLAAPVGDLIFYIAAVPALFVAAWIGSLARRAFREPVVPLEGGVVTDPPPPD